MHGAHMIATNLFKNFHMSHVEIFNAGQPRLARYPVHWHHAGYVGEKGGYSDPSSVDSLRRRFEKRKLKSYFVQICVGLSRPTKNDPGTENKNVEKSKSPVYRGIVRLH